jgi:hypothetical protein
MSQMYVEEVGAGEVQCQKIVMANLRFFSSSAIFFICIILLSAHSTADIN